MRLSLSGTDCSSGTCIDDSTGLAVSSGPAPCVVGAIDPVSGDTIANCPGTVTQALPLTTVPNALTTLPIPGVATSGGWTQSANGTWTYSPTTIAGTSAIPTWVYLGFGFLAVLALMGGRR